jgi:hypothetical protein
MTELTLEEKRKKFNVCLICGVTREEVARQHARANRAKDWSLKILCTAKDKQHIYSPNKLEVKTNGLKHGKRAPDEMKELNCVRCGANCYDIHKAQKLAQKNPKAQPIRCKAGYNHKYPKSQEALAKMKEPIDRLTKGREKEYGETLNAQGTCRKVASPKLRPIAVPDRVTVVKEYTHSYLVEFGGKRYVAAKEDVEVEN